MEIIDGGCFKRSAKSVLSAGLSFAANECFSVLLKWYQSKCECHEACGLVNITVSRR